jgi:hypothetical protein
LLIDIEKVIAFGTAQIAICKVYPRAASVTVLVAARRIERGNYASLRH